jgi:hypothetical protein
MTSHSRVIFSDHVDGNAIARHWIRKTGYMLQKGLDYRIRNQHKDQFTDIIYKELKDDSETVLSNIYSLDGGITPELMQKFLKAEKENPMGKYGIHEYRLEDFGVGMEDIIRETAAYRDFLSNKSVKV